MIFAFENQKTGEMMVLGQMVLGSVNLGPEWILKSMGEDVIEFKQIKCECGSEKLGLPGHSNWCLKHEESKNGTN